MSHPYIALFSSFSALNLTQFLTALNDNLYKSLLIFLLISLKGQEHCTTVLALAGAIFVIPFLLFAAPAGVIADRFSKQRVIQLTRILEVIIVISATVGFALESPLFGYIILFCMASLSALFSPCKYGILPEIVKREKLSHYNGLLSATTYLAIILGTFLASFLADITHRHYTLAVGLCGLIAALSLISSLFIEKTAPQAEHRRFSFNFFTTTLTTLQRAKKIRYLFAVLLFGAYFLFMGAFVQLNIIPFAIQSLHLSEIAGGYLFLLTALGIGLGSFLAGKVSKNDIELAFVALSAFFIAFVFIALFFFSYELYIAAPLLALVGLLGGFYIVPIDAFIQTVSPPDERGQNIATSNFLNFTGVIAASGLLALLGNVFKLEASVGFAIMGLLSLLVAIVLTCLLSDQLLRFIVARFVAPFWNIKVIGKQHLHLMPPALLIANRTSWKDTLIVMATLPRLVRYVIPHRPSRKLAPSFFSWLKLIALDLDHLIGVAPPVVKGQSHTIGIIQKELSCGHSVCLMLPSNLQDSTAAAWKKRVESLQTHFHVPLIAVHISQREKSIITHFSKIG